MGHAMGQAFIGQEKFSVIMASGFTKTKIFVAEKFFLNAVKCCNRSPKGNMWSAIPVALLCMLMVVGNG